MTTTSTTTTSRTRRQWQRTTLTLLGVSVLLMSALVTAPSADAQQSAVGSNPCPNFSIQNVFDDPNSDWDGDRVTNLVELNNGMKPCQADGDQFCLVAPSLCLKVYTPAFSCATTPWTWAAVNAAPNADWDNDGVSNIVEARNGANPCVHPCPNPTQIDLILNPHGSWDNDGISNNVEVSLGQNPCSATVYQPCPNWTTADISAQPNADWDRDGVSNRDEYYWGTNPCSARATIVTPTRVVPTYRYVAVTPTVLPAGYRSVPYVIQPPAGRSCPTRFLYYNPATLSCTSRPVVTHIY